MSAAVETVERVPVAWPGRGKTHLLQSPHFKSTYCGKPLAPRAEPIGDQNVCARCEATWERANERWKQIVYLKV